MEGRGEEGQCVVRVCICSVVSSAAPIWPARSAAPSSPEALRLLIPDVGHHPALRAFVVSTFLSCAVFASPPFFFFGFRMPVHVCVFGSPSLLDAR